MTEKGVFELNSRAAVILAAACIAMALLSIPWGWEQHGTRSDARSWFLDESHHRHLR